jgi:hypothetical protein
MAARPERTDETAGARRRKIDMRSGALIAIIVGAVVVVAGAAWFGIGYGLSRGSGPVVGEDRQVPAFTRVEVSGKGTLIISQGETPALRVEGQRNVLDRLETTVTGDTLRIEPRSRWFDYGIFWNNEPVTYHVTVTSLAGIELSGAVAVRGESLLRAEEFVLDCSGSSDVDLEIEARDLRVSTSGSSDVTLKGQADTVSFDGSGSTHVFAKDLVSRVATVDGSGSTTVEVNASERLNVDSSGSSTVSHVGHPILTTNISGSGEVRPLAE